MSVRRTPRRAVAGIAVAVMAAAAATGPAGASQDGSAKTAPWFQRLHTMPVHENTTSGEETAAEIAAVTADGGTVVYSDSPGERVGFAALGHRGGLSPDGTVDVGGEPTSVAVAGEHALVAIDTSQSYTEPSGLLAVVDIAERTIVAEHELGGQPDAVAVSQDGTHAAVAIENERDEDHGDGGLPQLPAGFLAVVDLDGEPDAWTVRDVDLTGLADVAPDDPEPEYVAINSRNEAVVTLQENNHLVVVDLPSGDVRNDFSAGNVTLDGVDTVADGTIDPSGSSTAVREPDAVAWLDDDTIGTADEGDWRGGSRTWTAFDTATGDVVWHSGTELEDLAVAHGQYPEHRAEHKGVEPEGIAVADYGRATYAFVGLERANLIAVYDVTDPRDPQLVHGMPTGVAPEGLLPIPERELFVVSAEEDDADNGIRSSLATYQHTRAPLESQLKNNKAAPSLVSDGIGFGGLSGLSAVPGRHGVAVAVHDDRYAPATLYDVDTTTYPATVTGTTALTRDGNDVDDVDLEGVAATGDGYWLVSEGDAETRENLLIRADTDGRVVDEITLPEEIAAGATRFGFEGVAVDGGHVWVAVQREWADNADGETTLARYTPATGEWAFAAYPLDDAPDGGWIGVSELTAVGDGEFLVLERDNQAGAAAETKKVYRIDLSDVAAVAAGVPKPVVDKTEELDVLPELAAGGGAVPDKIEGLAALPGPGATHDLVGVVDNDGVDDALGESVLLRLGRR